MRSNEEKARRVPIHTPYMRRDSIYNPEYLDAERALARFTPLLESVLRRMRSWCNADSEYDMEDLRSIIQTEFLRLHDKYDPAYGVDFPGYIKMNLERRVRYYVGRSQKHVGHEVLALASSVTDNYMESLPDENAQAELGRVDDAVSIPFDRIDDATYRDIIYRIIIGKEDVHSLARRYNVSARAMALKIDAAGEYVRQLMQEDAWNGEEEEGEAGTAADGGYLCRNCGDGSPGSDVPGTDRREDGCAGLPDRC